MMMDVMGLHMPGASFINPGTRLRQAVTRAAIHRLTEIGWNGNDYRPIGRCIDEKAIVNAIVGLLATGGSTNHAIHLPAMARAAGIVIDWEDFDRLSGVVPLIARVYPNGAGDVNHFHAAGGMSYVIASLIDAGLLHDDILTVAGTRLRDHARDPKLSGEGDDLTFEDAPAEPLDDTMLRPPATPFQPDGGMRLVKGNLGRATFKTSAVEPQRRTIEAPARVFSDQDDVIAAFKAGELERDVVVVVRFQGPRANGMPELHKLTPPLGVLQDRGHKVALVTDGRMSGASGKVPAAIHLSPEAVGGGPIGRIRDGDVIRLSAEDGVLECWSIRRNGMPARTPPRRRPASAPAASCSPSCATAPTMPSAAARRCWRPRASDDEKPGDTDMSPIDALMRSVPVIPVLVVEDAADAVPIAEALVSGGPDRPRSDPAHTPAALDVIRAMSSVEGAVVGAGTVLNARDLDAAIGAGAKFIVSPGLTAPLTEAATASGVPYLPGVATSADIMRGLDHGLERFKFFPAEAAGGLKALKALAAPFHRVRFCPTGGITETTAPDWLAHPSVLCVGGSWVVPAGKPDPAAIRRLAQAAAALRAV